MIKMTTDKSSLQTSTPRALLLTALCLLLLPLRALAVGHWVALNHQAPGAINLMLLLSDGTVMGQVCVNGNVCGSQWSRLIPDSSGSYVNGSWSDPNTVAPMHDPRANYSSAVLRSGKIFGAGGEGSTPTGGSSAELYDPVANTWTQINPPLSLLDSNRSQAFWDSPSMILANGNVLVAPVLPSTSNGTVIYDPAANTWLAGPATLAFQDEASWVKLPEDSVLTVDPYRTMSARYVTSLYR